MNRKDERRNILAVFTVFSCHVTLSCFSFLFLWMFLCLGLFHVSLSFSFFIVVPLLCSSSCFFLKKKYLMFLALFPLFEQHGFLVLIFALLFFLLFIDFRGKARTASRTQ